MSLPYFAVITPTGVARAIVEGRDTALRVCDHYTKQDMILHTIRPSRIAEDDRREVPILRNT